MTWIGSRALTIGLVSLLLLAACGGGDDDADRQPAGERTESPSTSTSEAGDATQAAGADSTPTFICEDPAPTELGLGQPHESDVATQRCFWVDVPEGVSSLTISVSDVTVEMRVGVYYGYVWHAQFPGTANYWNGRGDDGEDIAVSIGDPPPGPYFVYLTVGRGAVSDFTLEAATEPAMTADPTGQPIAGGDVCGGPAQVVASGQTYEVEVAARGRIDDAENAAHSYFCVEVPAGSDSLTIDLANASSRFDFQVVPPDHGGKFLYSPGISFEPVKSLTVEDVTSGAYYIDVEPQQGGGFFELTVTVR